MSTKTYRGGPGSISETAMADVGVREGEYPRALDFQNMSVARMTEVCPGIVEVESKHGGNNTLVLSGGIHGDEKAGVLILDRIIHHIRTGVLPVRRNLLLMYGNLMAMKANEGRGVRCVEPEVGITANLNRCFNRGTFVSPGCYAEHRANQMMDAVRRAVPKGKAEAIDIHQSFRVPRLCDVRGGDDRTEYTYAMVYPHDEKACLLWILDHYSDIVAGAVLNDIKAQHHTFAGFMANEYHARAATFEQGTIGHVDHVTFTPQLCDNLERSIKGDGKLPEPQGFDVWRCVRSIYRKSSDFSFLDAFGKPMQKAPLDFAPLSQRQIARDGSRLHLLCDGERILFANGDVPIGDRAAEIILGEETDIVPTPAQYAYA